jgi:tripartite-type tricarboxylate transporter receptor subunit TctC
MRKLIVVVATLTGIVTMAAGASAQGYPSRPITMIVPFPPGGPVETIGRIMGERLRAALGQPVIIENVPGASGSIGVARAARAAPDGYTLGMGNWSSHVGSPAIYPVTYDIVKDFEPVALLPIAPTLIVGKKALPANNLAELIAWLRANPDKATEGTAGLGSGQHISGVYFQKITGTKFQFVPYKTGSAEIMRDIVAGHIDLTFDQAITALPHVRGGNVKAYAVTSDARLDAAPDIPTVDEAGAPGIYISTWYGIWLPKGSPKEAIEKIGNAARAALADPAVRKRLIDLGQQIPPAAQQTAAALAAYQKAEIDKWHALIKEAGIKVE